MRDLTSNLKPPLVSVIMPVRNGHRFIGQAIDSILSQTLTDLELLVVDDASTDNTPEVVQSYTDPRLRYLHNPRCLGVSSSRNRAMGEARASFVAFLDADDIAYPQRLEAQIAYLENHPEVALVGSHLDYIDAEGELLYSEKPCQRPCEPDKLRRELLRRACILPSTAMGRKSALIEAGGFPPTAYAEDHDLWCRLAVKHDLAIMPERLVAYRQHPDQATFKKIYTGYRATRQCIEAARTRFLSEGVLSPEEVPPPLTLWGHLTGQSGTPGAIYVQWAELHSWALRDPRRGMTLAATGLFFSPLNKKAWRIFMRAMANWVVPTSVSKRMAWYYKRLIGHITRQ